MQNRVVNPSVFLVMGDVNGLGGGLGEPRRRFRRGMKGTHLGTDGADALQVCFLEGTALSVP